MYDEKATLESICILDPSIRSRWGPFRLDQPFGNGTLQRDGDSARPVSPNVSVPHCLGILFALMGISAARISLSPESKSRDLGLNLFVAQLVVNFFWSPIFFNAQAFGLAFGWLMLLWVLVLTMILVFHRMDPLAAWLQLPYLAWLTFAAYLSYGVWMLN